MSKIMLVEDDNNLREIYEARLAAEGYEIISAADGEAALALGIKEKPDLIIADIMMPKVSGFDMLDIMRSTTETKNAKIIMMTALNQAEDKARAEKLGADLYLVKSQVTLEDVVRSAKKMLGEESPLNIGNLPVHQPETNNQAQNEPQNATSMTQNAPPVPQPKQTANTQTSQQQDPTPQQNTPQPQAPTQQPANPTNNDAPTASQQVPNNQNPSQTEPQNVTQPTQPTPINVTEAPSNPAQTPTQQANSPAATTNQAPEQDPKSAAPSAQAEEAALQQQIEQFISSENPTISTDPNATANQENTTSQAPTATQPAASNTNPSVNQQTQAPASTEQPAPQPNNQNETQAATQPSSPSPQSSQPNTQQSSPSSMAAPPRDTPSNDPQTVSSAEDKPSGERVIQKSAAPGTQEGGLDPNAAISGRHKVIKPISDVLTKGPDINELLKKSESTQPGTAPTVNSVVSPEGITSTLNQNTPTNTGSTQGGQVMSDVIAPNPSATPKTDPNNPPAPPVA